MPSFADLRVPEPLLQALAGLRYREPTPIQAAAIPPLLAGRDLLGQAETGTGKTAAYGVPLAAATRAGVLGALVLVPTRELALQVTEALNAIGSTVGVRAVAVYGGVGYGRQGEALASGETTCVVATPGRLIDLLQQRALALDEVRFVVIDEADRMLDMGFLPDVERLFQQIPGKRQTVLMSATLPPDVQRLARHLLRDPVRVDVTGSALAAPLVEARYLVLDELDKPLAVQAYLEEENPFDILLFVSTRERADMVAQRLRKLKVDAAPFHGGIPQGKRERTLSSFVEGDVRVLVATDLAARGIDVRNLACVLNYDLPENTEAYVHRIGRTGRAGKRGVALSFVTPREVPALRAIARDAGTPLVPQRLPGFGERE